MDASLVIEQLTTVLRRLFSGTEGRVRLALVLTVTATLEATVNANSDALAAAVLANLIAVLPVLIALRFAFLAALFSSLAMLVLLGTPDAPVTLTALGVFLYATGNLVVHRGLGWALPLTVPFVLNALVPVSGGGTGLASVGPLVVMVAAILIAESLHQRSDAVAELDETREAMAASTREQTVMEERARIARELHDIVAHHLSVIAIQSDTARLTSPHLSQDARNRFDEIGGTARNALTETRRLLGVLREDADADADRSPQPGLEQLADLVDTARASGTQVRLTVQGAVVPLPPGVDLAAFRIVQEALTNARRHAPGADVDVELSYGTQALRLQVRDHGPGVSEGEPTPGHGLVGMRDRATIAGGTFTCGPARDAGFVVEAVLPIAAVAE